MCGSSSDLSSYALDPTMLPQAVRDGFAAMRQGEALYEVVVDFAQPDPGGLMAEPPLSFLWSA